MKTENVKHWLLKGPALKHSRNGYSDRPALIAIGEAIKAAYGELQEPRQGNKTGEMDYYESFKSILNKNFPDLLECMSKIDEERVPQVLKQHLVAETRIAAGIAAGKKTTIGTITNRDPVVTGALFLSFFKARVSAELNFLERESEYGRNVMEEASIVQNTLREHSKRTGRNIAYRVATILPSPEPLREVDAERSGRSIFFGSHNDIINQIVGRDVVNTPLQK